MSTKILATPAEIASAIFVKSSDSTNGGDCLEVATLSDGRRLLRDSKNRSAGVQTYTESEWAAFVGGVKKGEFG